MTARDEGNAVLPQTDVSKLTYQKENFAPAAKSGVAGMEPFRMMRQFEDELKAFRSDLKPIGEIEDQFRSNHRMSRTVEPGHAIKISIGAVKMNPNFRQVIYGFQTAKCR
jgi:hypothetical protein